jgi:hypothetical protein
VVGASRRLLKRNCRVIADLYLKSVTLSNRNIATGQIIQSRSACMRKIYTKYIATGHHTPWATSGDKCLARGGETNRQGPREMPAGP